MLRWNCCCYLPTFYHTAVNGASKGLGKGCHLSTHIKFTHTLMVKVIWGVLLLRVRSASREITWQQFRRLRLCGCFCGTNRKNDIYNYCVCVRMCVWHHYYLHKQHDGGDGDEPPAPPLSRHRHRHQSARGAVAAVAVLIINPFAGLAYRLAAANGTRIER